MRNKLQKTLVGLTALFIIIAGLTIDSNAKSINRIDQKIDINIINDIDGINIIGQRNIIENIDEINISQRIEIAKNISIERGDNVINQNIVNDINLNQINVIGGIERINYINNLRDIDNINGRIS